MKKGTLSESNSIMLLNMSNYSAPSITEEPGKEWVNYGQDNNYFGYLLDRYRGSATNHALINGIYQTIIGDGIESQDEEVNNLFRYDDLLKWAFDLKCLGFFIVQVIMSKDGTKIAKCKHTPVQNWRSGKADKNGVISNYYYSDDWEKYTNAQYSPKAYSAYNSVSSEPLQIFAVKPYRAGSFYYPNVDYQGSLQYAHIEEEISNFHINNLLNGMFPGLLINFNNGIPSEDERKKIEMKINQKWGQSSNAGKIIVAFNDDKERAATVEPVQPPDLDKMFDLLSKESSEKIMIGHRVTSPTLFGVRTGAGLGNNADELRVASILFEDTVLYLYRLLMANAFELLLKRNKNNTKITFKSLSPFDGFVQSDTEEVPNKMNIDSGITKEELSEHEHTPEMSDEMEKAYLDMVNPYGETVDEDEWYEADVSKVENEAEEEKIFSENGGK